jgi:hypothetical protein
MPPRCTRFDSTAATPSPTPKGWSLPAGGTQPGTWFHMVNRGNDHLSTFEIRNNGYLDDLRVEEASVVPPSAAGAPSVAAEARRTWH